MFCTHALCVHSLCPWNILGSTGTSFLIIWTANSGKIHVNAPRAYLQYLFRSIYVLDAKIVHIRNTFVYCGMSRYRNPFLVLFLSTFFTGVCRWLELVIMQQCNFIYINTYFWLHNIFIYFPLTLWMARRIHPLGIFLCPWRNLMVYIIWCYPWFIFLSGVYQPLICQSFWKHKA